MNRTEERLLYDKSEEIDWLKLRMILRKSIFWICLFMAITNLIGYLYVRWTKPLFISESILKLDIKSDAGILGFNAFEEEKSISNISGEIELIKSRMFSERVISTLDLEISYYSVGKILNDERYIFSPFKVELIQPGLFNTPVFIEFLADGKFIVSLSKDAAPGTAIYSVRDTIKLDDLQFQMRIDRPLPKETLQTKFFFQVNSREKLISYIENSLTVEPVNLNARTIKVSFKDFNPYKARDLVNAIDVIYLDYSKEEKQQANLQKIKFVDQQLQSTEDKLSQIEDLLESDAMGLQTVGLENEASDIIKRLKEIAAQKRMLSNQYTEAENLLTNLMEGDSVWIPQFISDQQDLVKNFSNFSNEKLRLTKLLKTFSKNTRIVQQQEELIAIQKDNLIQSVSALLESSRWLIYELNSERGTLLGKLKSIPRKSNDFNKTARYYTMYEDFYLSLMQNKTQFQIAQAGVTTDFKILSSASMPDSPVSPRRILAFGIGLVSGLVVCFFFIGFRYILHNRITSAEEIESRTKLPVLGSIPFYHQEKLKTSKLLVGKHPRSAISESLRAVRTNLEFFIPQKGNQILAVTSTVSGEGKTFFSVNLGGIISMSSKKVIVVDLDMRRPKVHQALGIENPSGGVSTILIGKQNLEDCIHSTAMSNLHFLSAGPPPPNPSELLLKPAFDQLLAKLGNLYEVIILDTPPVGLVTDGILALKKANLPIYVVRADFSKSHYLETLMRLNKLHKFDNLTVLLNSVKVSRQGYGYGYGYGYGGEYYQSENTT